MMNFHHHNYWSVKRQIDHKCEIKQIWFGQWMFVSDVIWCCVVLGVGRRDRQTRESKDTMAGSSSNAYNIATSLSPQFISGFFFITHLGTFSLSLSTVLFMSFSSLTQYCCRHAVMTILQLLVLHNRRQTLLSFPLQLWLLHLHINAIFFLFYYIFSFFLSLSIYVRSWSGVSDDDLSLLLLVGQRQQATGVFFFFCFWLVECMWNVHIKLFYLFFLLFVLRLNMLLNLFF